MALFPLDRQRSETRDAREGEAADLRPFELGDFVAAPVDEEVRIEEHPHCRVPEGRTDEAKPQRRENHEDKEH